MPMLEEIVEESAKSDEENTENEDNDGDVFRKSSMLAESEDVVGRDMFGFMTPRKGKAAMQAKVEQEQARTPGQRTPLYLKNTPAR